MSSCIPTDRLLQSLRVQVPGATSDMLNLQVFNVVDEFLRRTMAWQVTQPITLTTSEVEYSLETPPNAAIVRLIGVTHNGTPVLPSQSGSSAVISGMGRLLPELVFPDEDARFAPDVIDSAPPAGIFTYAIYRPDYITVTTPPTEEQIQYPMVAAYALSVSAGCLECECGDWDVPDWMWEMYFQDWFEGVLGKLYGMPSKPWTDLKQSVVHAKKFRNRMAFRKQESVRGFTFNVPTWRFPRGWV